MRSLPDIHPPSRLDDPDFVSGVVSPGEAAIGGAPRRPGFDVDWQIPHRGRPYAASSRFAVAAHRAMATAGLPPIHGGPFARLAFAQAGLDGVVLLTADATIPHHPGPIRRV